MGQGGGWGAGTEGMVGGGGWDGFVGDGKVPRAVKKVTEVSTFTPRNNSGKHILYYLRDCTQVVRQKNRKIMQQKTKLC